MRHICQEAETAAAATAAATTAGFKPQLKTDGHRNQRFNLTGRGEMASPSVAIYY